LLKITPVSFQQLVSRFRRLGFDGPFSGGKHLYMIKGSIRLTIPNPHRQEVGVDLLKRLLKQAGISQRDWLGDK
jgi:predicted RNA binding protein YcfA (HicA-like mRNA interferase family)